MGSIGEESRGTAWSGTCCLGSGACACHLGAGDRPAEGDLCVQACVRACICMDMHMGMHMGMCMGMCMDMCTNMCMDLCMDLCMEPTGMRMDICTGDMHVCVSEAWIWHSNVLASIFDLTSGSSSGSNR